MNKFRMSETIAARLFLLALLVLCIVVSVMCFPPLATAEGISTPTGSEQTQLPEFSFKFRSANGWSNQAQEQLAISIVDKYQTGWEKVEVRIDDDAWDDVTSDVSGDNTYQMNVWKNCTVTVRVTDTQGTRHTGRVSIDFFDFVNPTVTAGIRTSLLHPSTPQGFTSTSRFMGQTLFQRRALRLGSRRTFRALLLTWP